MTRMVSQILWEHCMGELGYGGNDYENDTFVVRSYNWVDEDANDWHFWHKQSGLKIEWYKYPLRGFEANMEITDDQFLDVLLDCTNSMEDGKRSKVLHEVRRWWADRKTEDAVDKKVDAVGYCESCDWCEYEFVKSDGSEDKRYRNHKWCGLHERSTKKDGFCHWFLERLGEDDKN